MDIFLVRHAPAIERSDRQDDALRPLSTRGRKRFVKAVMGLQQLGVAFDHVFHSPWLRAVQTAELLEPINTGGRATTDLLITSPGVDLINLARQFSLERARPDARVAFVGHQPWMSELLSLLITGDAQHAENLPFKKGGVAWLTGVAAPAGAELVAVIPPRNLRRFASAQRE